MEEQITKKKNTWEQEEEDIIISLVLSSPLQSPPPSNPLYLLPLFPLIFYVSHFFLLNLQTGGLSGLLRKFSTSLFPHWLPISCSCIHRFHTFVDHSTENEHTFKTRLGGGGGILLTSVTMKFFKTSVHVVVPL